MVMQEPQNYSEETDIGYNNVLSHKNILLSGLKMWRKKLKEGKVLILLATTLWQEFNDDASEEIEH